MKRVCLIMASLVFAGQVFAKTLAVNDVRIITKANELQLVFGLSDPFSYKLFTLEKPDRVVIDFPKATLDYKLSELKWRRTAVKQIRNAKHNDALRLVVDLDEAFNVKDYSLKPEGSYGHRLVVHLQSKQSSTQALANQLSNVANKTKTVVKKIPALHRKLRDVVVVLDPGHGGKDPGAIGAKNTQEKHVVLAVAKQLQCLINKEPGMQAVLTRNSDYYIPLRERLSLARKKKGDVFISIHADAFKRRTSHGASVFALSQRGATSEAARWLAEKENYSELGGVNLSGLNDQSGLLRSVLIDLSQTATLGNSIQLGSGVLKHLGDIAALHSKRIEQAPFVVLKSPDIPSILIEVGFISNPKEAVHLTDKTYHQKLANAVLTGLRQYFWLNAPADTWIAVQRSTKKYTVSAGDSLSKLAKQHHISVSNLKQINQLKTENIKVGQILHIPQSHA